MRVGIRELKSRLSHYLSLIKAGQTVEITARGKPIGRIVPMSTWLEVMEKLGLLRGSRGKLASRAAVARVHGTKTVTELLVEERG